MSWRNTEPVSFPQPKAICLHQTFRIKFSMLSKGRNKNGPVWGYFTINRPKNLCSAQNKGCITAKPSPSRSLGHRSLLGVLFASFKVLFVLCLAQEVAFNFTNHTYTSSLHQEPEMRGKSCFSQFCSEQNKKVVLLGAPTPQTPDTKVDGNTVACALHANSIYEVPAPDNPPAKVFWAYNTEAISSRKQSTGWLNRPELSVAKMVTSKAHHSSEVPLQDNT